MVSHDIELIKKIEQELGKPIDRSGNLDSDHCYSVNDLEQVICLRLIYCNIANINKYIKYFLCLQTLDLSNNQLSDISALKELSNLQELNLSRNQLNDISVIKELVNLQNLDLSWNQLNDISALKELSNLQELNLSRNQLNNISIIKELVNLQNLDLSWNQLNDISVLKELKNLQKLDLHGNELSDISALEELRNLQKLDLSYNELNDIFALKELSKLHKLNLGRNQLSDISVIKKLHNLQHVDLRNNKIIRLPQWIAELKPDVFSGIFEDGKINVSGNPLVHPPPEIIQQGREALRAYFRSFENDQAVTLHEAKVLLVGDGKAGKTSLLKRFQGLDFDEHESQTHGINVLTLYASKLPDFISPAEDCRLHVWDFGGQEIIHASHRFFMSKRSLYILVLDSRDDTSRGHLRWLRHIKEYGDASPIIVAMNKIDLNPSYNVAQNKLNDSFPQIEHRFFRISCKNKDGFDNLFRSIAASVPQTELYGMKISTSWFTIRTRLEEEAGKKNYISKENFISICKEHGVEDEVSRMTMLKLFNDLGTVLFFEQLTLTDIYVLDPHWVTTGVYKIINSVTTKEGILREDDLEFILNKEQIRCDEYDPLAHKQFTYSTQERAYLVQIMQEFKLCYPYDKHQHILPNKLPIEPKEKPTLTKEPLLRFIIKYDQLPSSLFSRLMVRLQGDIADRQHQWRYGMLLHSKRFNVQAVIKAEEQTDSIVICIQGGLNNKRQYLSVIRHQIAELGFYGKEPEEFVPLPGHPDVLVKYQNLLGFERRGRNDYYDGILDETFSVSELLDSVVIKEERITEGNAMNVYVNPTMTQNNNQHQEQSQRQQQTVTLHNQIKDAQELFKNLKEDILAEAAIEIDDEKEKKRIENELNKAEKSLAEVESAAKNGEVPSTGTKSRLEEFFNSLADKSSRLGKTLELVSNGADQVRKLARAYNSFATNLGLPAVPPLLLGKGEE